MKPYRSEGTEKQKVISYEIGNDFLIVQFDDLTLKRYTNQITGSSAVIMMKYCAETQDGLEEFISNHNPLSE